MPGRRAPDDSALLDALADSQRLGMLGARPLHDVIEHSRHFVRALALVTGGVVDLGAGGGVPGLVLAWDRPDLRVTLLDRRATRTDHLRRLVGRLQMSDSVTVICGDAARLCRVPPYRHSFDAVTSRGFGPPEATMRRAAEFVAPGGLIVVSEPPPGAQDRWDPELLAELGLHRHPGPSAVAIFRAP